jgi:hypothetical protein
MFYKLEQMQKLLGFSSIRQTMTTIMLEGIEKLCKEKGWEIKKIREDDKQQTLPFVLTEE